MIKIAKLLKEGKDTRSSIVDKMISEGLTVPENAYWYLNRLWEGGCIVEKIFK